jgi:hypothetical protein
MFSPYDLLEKAIVMMTTIMRHQVDTERNATKSEDAFHEMPYSNITWKLGLGHF